MRAGKPNPRSNPEFSVSPSTLTVSQALDLVLGFCRTQLSNPPPSERVSLVDALGRVLAERVLLDQDQPPFDRAMRDGYAIVSADLEDPSRQLHCVGEVKAGEIKEFEVKAGTAVQIMTGAPVPTGFDAVVMVEHTLREGEDLRVGKPVRSGDNVARRGSERTAGEVVLDLGKRIQTCDLAVLAAVGRISVQVYRKPDVAILSTGDELVPIQQVPQPGQIRNSNSHSLYGQVARAGGNPRILESARDDVEDLRRKIAAGLECDLLLVSGGVSMGKYDLVEGVLSELGAHIHFDSVAMRPGKPVVFASHGKQAVFGLPGNPVSSFVTFELFCRSVLKAAQGLRNEVLPLVPARLEAEVHEKSGRTAFLPAQAVASSSSIHIRPVEWRGSADIFGLSGANALLLVPEEVSWLPAGASVQALLFDELLFEEGRGMK
ncbi:MAG: gephyrin-like molybdotransferase Glp [Acidobacteriota bacterium]